jgi:DNA-binding NarL/FixJ family response regulator
VRESTRNILEQSGDIVVVGEASDGAEAVERVRQLRPDVALLDIGLPGINGIEAARRIRALSPTTAILALTAFDDDPYVLALVEAGVAGYLLKNCYSEELIAAVRAVKAGEFVLSPQIAQRMLGRQGTQRQRDANRPNGETLSEREREVLRLAAKGLTNKAIARQLSLSPRTVQIHLAHAFRKLEVSSRTEAVMVGVRQGWLSVGDAA